MRIFFENASGAVVMGLHPFHGFCARDIFKPQVFIGLLRGCLGSRIGGRESSSSNECDESVLEQVHGIIPFIILQPRRFLTATGKWHLRCHDVHEHDVGVKGQVRDEDDCIGDVLQIHARLRFLAAIGLEDAIRHPFR